MSVFVELTLDDFASVFQNQVSNSRAGTGSRYGAGKSVNVRRPVRGLEVKEDTYAMCKVIDAAGNQIPLFDSGSQGGTTTQYANFLLQNVQEARMEKQQIVETFGEPYIFFFGEQPRFIDVQTVLLNSLDFNWHAEWWQNYDQYLRGTKLTEMGARLYLFYDDIVVEGYMLMSSTAMTQMEPLYVTMNFRMFVTNYSNVSMIGDDAYPIRASAQLYNFSNANLSAGDPADPNQPTSQLVLNEQAYLGILQQTGQIQAEQELDKLDLQGLLTAQQQEAAAQQALASSGFGGGGLLVQMLQAGLTSGSFPTQNIEGFITNTVNAFAAAMQSAFGGPVPDPGRVRQLPIRSNITDNTDEYLNWSGGDITPPGVQLPTDQSQGVFGPVGGDSPDPIETMSQQACMLGTSMNPESFYGFNMVPYTPGQGFGSAGAYGRPSGAGAGFSGGVSASLGLTGTVGTGYYPGSSGGIGLGVGGGIGGSPDLINILRSNGQVGFFGGSFAGPGSPSGIGVVPGVGYGYGQNYGTGYNASYGYTAGVGGSFGGGMGGSFGPGIGGGLGGWGSASFGNPQYFQSGNPLVQNFLQSPYGTATGTPFGLAITSSGPASQNVYAYTAGIAPDGTLQGIAPSNPNGIGTFAGAGFTGGFGATSVNSPPTLFSGSVQGAAVASFGAGISGDGAFGLQALPGTLDPTLQGGTNSPCNLGA